MVAVPHPLCLDFNGARRFCRSPNDVGEHLERMADTECQTEMHSVTDLLDEIENENISDSEYDECHTKVEELMWDVAVKVFKLLQIM